MKGNTSASSQGSSHESRHGNFKTKKIKLDTTNENLFDGSSSSCTNTGGSNYVKACKESIMARNCVARTG